MPSESSSNNLVMHTLGVSSHPQGALPIRFFTKSLQTAREGSQKLWIKILEWVNITSASEQMDFKSIMNFPQGFANISQANQGTHRICPQELNFQCLLKSLGFQCAITLRPEEDFQNLMETSRREVFTPSLS